MMNDSLMEVFNQIQKLTPPNAIICSHWQNGDYIMYFSKRATFYCAAIQQIPVTY
ncbi:MAG: hypothetical protein NC923_00945 [Candidatus Omnitrophica bacterium]|nr:hypothetical protein [Candidatus Omnitrophota bacterium]